MIIAVVVTYNRLECLKVLLNGLQQQTILPDRIIVVNNDSTDGTGEWLTTRNDLVVIHQENSGGSGGFHTGVKAAFEQQADWIWIMDDDVIPRSDCLQVLLEHKHLSECLHPIHIDHNKKLIDEETWFNPENCQIINFNNRSMHNGKTIFFRNMGWFEGMLISRQIVDKIGYPDKRFFLTRDDVIYGYLASKFTNVAVIAGAIFERQEIEASKNRTYNYEYYKFRNLWILEEYLNEENDKLKGYRHRRILGQFLYAIYKVFRLNEFKSKRKVLIAYWTAYKDYRSKKYGKGPL